MYLVPFVGSAVAVITVISSAISIVLRARIPTIPALVMQERPAQPRDSFVSRHFSTGFISLLSQIARALRSVPNVSFALSHPMTGSYIF